MVDKLVEECTEAVKEVKLVKITSTGNENKRKCSSCTLYIVLFLVIFLINIGIGTNSIYFYWYLKKMLLVLSLVPVLKQRFNKLINGRSQTNRDKKSNLLFLQQHDQSQTFRLKLVKNRQKALLQRD